MFPLKQQIRRAGGFWSHFKDWNAEMENWSVYPCSHQWDFFRVKQASDYFKACLKSSLGVAHAQRQIPLQIGAANIGGP